MLNVIIILSIIFTIVLGYNTHINTGFFAIAFAYIIGTFVMGLKPTEVIAMWPTSTFFVFFTVSLFFNIPASNGTLNILSKKMVYICRKKPQLIPYAVFVAALIMSGLGVSFLATIVFMAPITLSLAEELKIDKYTMAICAFCGTAAGCDFVTGGNGIVYISLIENIGYTEPNSICFFAFIVCFIFFFLFITIYLLTSKSFVAFKQTMIKMEKPESLNKRQQLNLMLIIILILCVLLIPSLTTITKLEFLAKINDNIHIGLISVVLATVSLLLKLSDQDSVLAGVPWGTLIMISGVGMLVAVAVRAGTTDAVGKWISSNLPPILVPVVFSFIASFMSFFSSASGVVCPALFPMVPALASSTGHSPILLFSAIIIGAQATAISPFSTGGSMILAACPNEKERDILYHRLLTSAVPSFALSSALFALILGLLI